MDKRGGTACISVCAVEVVVDVLTGYLSVYLVYNCNYSKQLLWAI